MRSMIQESLKEMREIGARSIEIERIRYHLRRGNVPKEAFQGRDMSMVSGLEICQ